MPHAAVALLLAPVAVTWAGANLLTVMETRHVTQVRQSATARLEASTQARAIEAARVRIAPWFTAPTIGALTTPIAGVLPDDVELSDIEVSGKALTLTLATADPDTLRAALRNDPILGALHEIDQAAGSDGRMRVTLRGLVR